MVSKSDKAILAEARRMAIISRNAAESAQREVRLVKEDLAAEKAENQTLRDRVSNIERNLPPPPEPTRT